MTGDSSTSDEDPRAVDLAKFIDENSDLFVVMGVFAALAVYIWQFPTEGAADSELMTALGFVSAFALSLLMLILVYSNLLEQCGSWTDFYRAHLRFDNVLLTAFTLFTSLLALSLSSILTSREPAIFLILLAGTAIMAIAFVYRLVYEVAVRLPYSPIWRISAILGISSVTLAGALYLQSEYISELQITTIQEMSFSEPIPIAISLFVMLVATIQSLAATGILAGILSIPIVAFDKICGVSPYDNPEKK